MCSTIMRNNFRRYCIAISLLALVGTGALPAQADTVFVDGVNVKDYSLYNLREGVGMVLQKNVLFSGTIAENLRWGDEEATEEEITAMATAAQADKFVSTFKEGYETQLDKGGNNLSGGQKQRLCIARALMKKPKILRRDMRKITER